MHFKYSRKSAQSSALLYAADGLNKAEVREHLEAAGYICLDLNTSLLFYNAQTPRTYIGPNEWLVWNSYESPEVMKDADFRRVFDAAVPFPSGTGLAKDNACAHTPQTKSCTWCGFELYDQPVSKAIEVGDLVKAVGAGHAFRTPAMKTYDHTVAVAVSTNGSVDLVSLDCGHVWLDMAPAYYVVIGKASREQLKRCRQKLINS